MTFKNKVRLIVLIPLSIYLLYCSWHFIYYPEQPTYLDCGIVISKSNDEVSIKHGSKTELYLNVQFNKTGFKSIECNPTTYFSKQKGDSVCFDLNEKTSFWYELNNFIGFLVIYMMTAVSISAFIYYLVTK